MGKITYFLRQLICLPILVYQRLISPFLRPTCRFYPSCSEYTLTAVQQLGVIKGIMLACRRIIRCHPLCEGGYDPISPEKEKRQQ